jgi:hypothetical protein
MIHRAWKHGMRVSYVLMDSWFKSSEMIKKIRKVAKGSLLTIGLVKVGKQRYDVEGKMLHCRQIILGRERKHSCYCRKYKSCYMKVGTLVNNQAVVLFFIQYGQQIRWHLLLTTQTELNFIQAFELYQIRWNIEVPIKEAKQHLALGLCLSRDFDVQIGDCTLTFITVLRLYKRISKFFTLLYIGQKISMSFQVNQLYLQTIC